MTPARLGGSIKKSFNLFSETKFEAKINLANHALPQQRKTECELVPRHKGSSIDDVTELGAFCLTE